TGPARRILVVVHAVSSTGEIAKAGNQCRAAHLSRRRFAGVPTGRTDHALSPALSHRMGEGVRKKEIVAVINALRKGEPAELALETIVEGVTIAKLAYIIVGGTVGRVRHAVQVQATGRADAAHNLHGERAPGLPRITRLPRANHVLHSVAVGDFRPLAEAVVNPGEQV